MSSMEYRGGSGAVVVVVDFRAEETRVFLLVKAEVTRSRVMTMRPAVLRVAASADRRGGSSWRLDASSPQKQVDAVDVVVGRKSVCEREERISGSRQASGCGLYFWCVVCCALCMHSCARRSDPTLSSLPESRHTVEAMPTALSAQPFFALASHTLHT